MLQVGDRAPDFRRKDHRGEEIALADLLERGPVVLYFYPRDFTPGCTVEACAFRDAFSDLQARSASVIGVSADDDASHARFASTYKLPFALVSDLDRSLAKAYDITWPLKIMGARRATFVIDKGGIIRGVFHHELAMKAHVEGVTTLLPRLEATA